MQGTPVASLPMYDWPEVRPATDALWSAVAARLAASGIAAPPALDRDRHLDAVWTDPALTLSQTCGYPFATRLAGRVRLVATPVFEAEGCEGPFYSSVIVARRGEGAGLADFSGRRFAFNAADSLSGSVALRAAMRAAGLDPGGEAWLETGGHRASVRAVAEGRADIAAIDAVCFALATRFEPEAVARLAIVDTTPLRPALPFITSLRHGEGEVAAIRAALATALADPGTRPAREALLLAGLGRVDEAAYAALADLGHA